MTATNTPAKAIQNLYSQNGSSGNGNGTHIRLSQEVGTAHITYLPDPLRPLTFEEYLDYFDDKSFVELINGVGVERVSAQLEHEYKQTFLLTVLNCGMQLRDLGTVLGSRTAVRIHPYQGRLPDILFVRKERSDILERKGLFSAPDMVLEIISENDSAGDMVALEADYRSIGAAEIIFVDAWRRKIRVLRKQGEGETYSEEVLTEADPVLRIETMGNLLLRTAWLFAEVPPPLHEVLPVLFNQDELLWSKPSTHSDKLSTP